MTAPSGSTGSLRVGLASGIRQVSAHDWDALFDADYPFTRHAFLAALEAYGCVGSATGWEPCHLLVHERDELVGAAPLYLKHHSYGEFVFDFAWAHASHRLGRRYYPKLVCAVPFVPSVGPRIGARDPAVGTLIARSLRTLAAEQGLSSAHALFPRQDDAALLREAGWLERTDVQFHWINRDYRDFADFASRLRSDKRKKLLRDRRRVAEAGIAFTVRRGDDLDLREWRQVYRLYSNTYEERGQRPYLTLEFFLGYGPCAHTPVHVIMGYEGPRLVAAALTWAGEKTLYGRHWGAAEHYDGLHFECCYHQGIELAIRLGLQRYDAGTQGEHKLARGFEPRVTRSFHTLTDARLAAAVGDYLRDEREQVAVRHAELEQHMPYRDRFGPVED